MKHEGLTYEQYAELEGVNWSRLRAIRKSALHFRYKLQHPQDDEAKHLRIGSVTHAYLLEPETVERRFVVWTGKVRNGKKWDEFREEHAHQTILGPKEMEAGIGAAKAVLAHPIAGKLLVGGLREASFTWNDRETGLKCKARVDHTNRYVTEVKTTAQLAPRLFENSATRIGYHGQLAFYGDGLRENGIAIDPEPRIICVESEAPHDVVVFRIPAFVVEEGRDLYRRLLKKLARCIETNEWPGRAEAEELVFTMPMWALDEDDEDGAEPNLQPTTGRDSDPDWMRD